jgi:hypothetical protein
MAGILAGMKDDGHQFQRTSAADLLLPKAIIVNNR